MTRNRKSARNAGTWLETAVANTLAIHIDDRIERRRTNGANDRGDISGLRIGGARVVVECKEYGGRILPGPWIGELETEMINDDAELGFVVAKRRGTQDPLEQYVLCTLGHMINIINAGKGGGS